MLLSIFFGTSYDTSSFSPSHTRNVGKIRGAQAPKVFTVVYGITLVVLETWRRLLGDTAVSFDTVDKFYNIVTHILQHCHIGL